MSACPQLQKPIEHGGSSFRAEFEEAAEKGRPADEQGAGKRGVEGADTPGITLGDMTEDAHTV
jgi:hypothetical protein